MQPIKLDRSIKTHKANDDAFRKELSNVINSSLRTYIDFTFEKAKRIIIAFELETKEIKDLITVGIYTLPVTEIIKVPGAIPYVIEESRVEALEQYKKEDLNSIVNIFKSYNKILPRRLKISIDMTEKELVWDEKWDYTPSNGPLPPLDETLEDYRKFLIFNEEHVTLTPVG